MKTTLFAGAAMAAALIAAPSSAQESPTGYVGAAYARTEVDAGAFDDEFDGWSVDGAVAFGVGDGSLGVQIDGAWSTVDESDAYGADAHLFTRNDSYLFGGFVGLSDGDGSDTTYTLGVEAQKYLEAVTLAGVVAYADGDDNGGDGAWGVGGEARYFVTDNFKLSGGVGFADFDGEELISLGVGGEYQFDAAPISVYANYARNEFDNADLSADTFSVGVRYSFGGTTLKSRDRSGASLTGASSVFGGLF